VPSSSQSVRISQYDERKDKKRRCITVIRTGREAESKGNRVCISFRGEYAKAPVPVRSRASYRVSP